MSITVIKSSGDRAQFDERKLRGSLERSGASSTKVDQIIAQVNAGLFDGITTKQIYKKAFGLLRKSSSGSAGRYKLRNAILELGPTGYPFERFMGKLMADQGYAVEVGVVVKGHSVNHEIDVWAERDDEAIMMECKYHNRAEVKCDVKVPMYILSRYYDVKKQWEKKNGDNKKTLSVWIATNTQFSADAIDFARSYGITLLAWAYPEKGNLRERIDNSGLYPLTCLTSLSKQDKRILLEKDIVLIRDIVNDPLTLNSLCVDDRKKNRILKNAEEMLAEG